MEQLYTHIDGWSLLYDPDKDDTQKVIAAEQRFLELMDKAREEWAKSIVGTSIRLVG